MVGAELEGFRRLGSICPRVTRLLATHALLLRRSGVGFGVGDAEEPSIRSPEIPALLLRGERDGVDLVRPAQPMPMQSCNHAVGQPLAFPTGQE